MVRGVACRASGTGFPALFKCFSSQVKGGEENIENFFSNCSVSELTNINKCRPILVQGLRRDIEINFSVAQWISAWRWI